MASLGKLTNPTSSYLVISVVQVGRGFYQGALSSEAGFEGVGGRQLRKEEIVSM